jgi:two-component system, cell cycle response regulator
VRLLHWRGALGTGHLLDSRHRLVAVHHPPNSFEGHACQMRPKYYLRAMESELTIIATVEDKASDSHPTILLVEDEPISRLMTSRRLQRAGYEVEAVTNGREALARLSKRFFPMLLTDWDMPKMDGVTLCKAVRAMPLAGYVYIILLTAREGTANVIEGLAAGADDYLTKPPNDNELQARLNTGRRILNLERSLRAANQKLHVLSIQDALTQTFNRRHLMVQLPQELDRARRYARHLSIVLCDVDHFKIVNDTHGHQAGDEALKGFADLIVASTRKGIDWVARYGGEEFFLVLPETSLSAAMAVAEKLRLAIAAHSFELADGPLRMSSSFGVASYNPDQPSSEASVDELIACADECLYRSKTEGRNRVTGEALSH